MAESKPKAADAKAADAVEAQAAEVQKITDEAERKGYLGEAADKTPNRNYTVAGVLEGAPTPETSPES